MKSILFPFIFCSFSAIAQTCIIAKIEDKNTIYLGSDTRTTRLDFNYQTKQFDSVYFTQRKIFNVGKYCFSTSGLLIDVQKRIADSVCHLNYDSNETIEIFHKVFYSNLISTLSDYQQKEPATFQKILQDFKIAMSQTVFCRFENGLPIIRFVEYSIVNNNLGQPQLKFETYSTKSDIPYIFGANDHTEKLKTDKKMWQTGPVNGIKKLIRIEADAHPTKVARPIDIFTIKPDKVSLTRYEGNQ